MDNSTGQDDTEKRSLHRKQRAYKQSTISFKNKKKVRKPESEWFRVENTHEAIIDKDVFFPCTGAYQVQTPTEKEQGNTDIRRTCQMR